MYRKIVSILFLLLFIPQIVFANNETWAYLDNIIDQTLLLTKQEKYAEAKQMLTHFSDQFLKTYPKDENITMNDLRVITISTDEAIKALTAVSLQHTERIRKVTQLRLAIDALHSDHQPIWMDMEKTILKSFELLKEAALSNDKEKLKLQFNHFSTNFDTIYPSLVIDLDPDEISRLDSHLRFLETYDRISEENKKEHLALMEKDLLKLFGIVTDDEADPSLIWVMVTTGSVIFGTLVYVGWRKYKGEKSNSIKDQGRP